MDNLLKNKKILVTGGSGFIGSHLVRELHNMGADTYSLSQRRSDKKIPAGEFTGDIADTDFVNEVMREVEPEMIFHLAGFTGRSIQIPDFYGAIKSNVTGSLNILSAATKLKNIESVVMLGTSEEYGLNIPPFKEGLREHPVNAYSFSKVCSTYLSGVMFDAYNLPVTVLRPGIVYGPGQSPNMFIPSLITSLADNRLFPMTNGEQTRDFVFISDVVRALILAAMTQKARGKIINIGSGRSVRLKDLALMAGQIMDKTELIQIGKIDYRPNDIMDYRINVTLAQEILGWEVMTGLKEGLEQTIQYYSSR